MAGIKLKDYVDFLEAVLQQESYYQPLMSLTYYKDLDWEDLNGLSDIEIQENQVVIYHEVYGESVICKMTLVKIVLDYGDSLLEIYKDRNDLPFDWSNSMEVKLNAVRNKYFSA